MRNSQKFYFLFLGKKLFSRHSKKGKASFISTGILFLMSWLNAGFVYAQINQFPFDIPHTTREMKTPGYWISRHPNPDHVVLKDTQIRDFNKRLEQHHLTFDLFAEQIDSRVISNAIGRELLKFQFGRYYNTKGNLLTGEEISQIRSQLNFQPNMISARYAMVMRMTNQRLLPTMNIYTAKPGDIEFDEVQNSSLDIGTAVIVLTQTRNHEWSYVYTQSSSGWVKTADLSFFSKSGFQARVLNPDIVVVTSAKADLYRDPQRQHFVDFVRMGARFAVKSWDQDMVEVYQPNETEGVYYLNPQDVHRGYLLYTARHVYEQAFKLLNAPYGWGGLNGEQDCSSMLMQIFSTVGIVLPRNSSQQGQAGRPVGDLSTAKPGISVAQLKGHIVLLLGFDDNMHPYAIHATHAYMEHGQGQDYSRLVNRVIVSDFYLGQGTAKGSLYQRIVAIRELD